MTAPLFEPRDVVSVPSARLPKLDAYLVVAFWRGGHWKIFPDQWMSLHAAERAVEELPIGYLHAHVLHVQLDPQGEAEARKASREDSKSSGVAQW